MKSLWSVGGRGNRPSLRLQNLRLLARYPGLVPKLAYNYTRVLAGKRVLRGVEFAVTYRCNLACRHCLKSTVQDDSRQEMTVEEIVEAARRIERLGGIFINYTGGEPILRDDIYEIVDRTTRLRGIIATLASNGYDLDDDKIARLARAGLSMVALSLDGASARTHDSFRGCEGLFDRVLAAIETIQARGMDAWLVGVATEEALQTSEARRMADLADRLGCPLTLNLPYDVGEWKGKDVALSPDAYGEYLDLLRLPHVRWEGSSNWLREGCPAGVEKIYVTPYGDVFPCAVIQQSFGNLRERPLAEIYQDLGNVPFYRTCNKPCLVAEQDLHANRTK